MKSASFMVIAGETSGDSLAADLVKALRQEWISSHSPGPSPRYSSSANPNLRFFGAGGPHMEAAGVELAFEMSSISTIGLWEALKQYGYYRERFHRLLQLASHHQPDAIIGVDFSGFNRRFAAAVKTLIRSRQGTFNNWNPRLIQFVSPQVWASRAGRVRQMTRTYDLVLTIFPFEQAWYEKHAPSLPVKFVGHPMVDRFTADPLPPKPSPPSSSRPPFLVLLPGSRRAEITRHLPVMLQAVSIMRQIQPDILARVILPNRDLADLALAVHARNLPPDQLVPLLTQTSENIEAASRHLKTQADPVEFCVGQLAPSLQKADLAIASTGTVTMECAYFQVPTVTLYKTSWSTYQIGRRIIKVPFLSMPNLLANESLYPEFIQDQASPQNIAREALALLETPARRSLMQDKLAKVIQSLGSPGAANRAAREILQLL